MLQNVNLLQGLTSDETKTSERSLIFIFLMMMSHEPAVTSSVGNNLVPRAFPRRWGGNEVALVNDHVTTNFMIVR